MSAYGSVGGYRGSAYAGYLNYIDNGLADGASASYTITKFENGSQAVPPDVSTVVTSYNAESGDADFFTVNAAAGTILPVQSGRYLIRGAVNIDPIVGDEVQYTLRIFPGWRIDADNFPLAIDSETTTYAFGATRYRLYLKCEAIVSFDVDTALGTQPFNLQVSCLNAAGATNVANDDVVSACNQLTVMRIGDL